jgi:murein L,D-transpeptidase YcbB/YkuD
MQPSPTSSSTIAVNNVMDSFCNGRFKSSIHRRFSSLTGFKSQLHLALALGFTLFVQPLTWAEDGFSQSELTAHSIADLVTNPINPLLKDRNFSKFVDEFKMLYESNQYQLLWTNSNSDQQQLQTALDLLANANAQGLNPIDYDVQTLKNELINLSSAQSQQRIYFDAALSVALIRFSHDLHEGRVTPQTLNYSWKFSDIPPLNTAEAIRLAISQNTLAQLPDKLEPKVKQYQLLKARLAEFRRQSVHSDAEILNVSKTLRPNDSFPQLDLLKQRLQDLGAWPESSEANPTQLSNYQGALVEGIKKLQREHGLQADGIIGRDTAALLTQNHADKIKQIELTMERLRWLPRDLSGPLILVNIPAFELSAFNSLDQERTLNMKVIVGKAPDNQTPMLFEDMEYIEFKPYWNIPKSIMDKEILPKLMSNWNYLQNQNIELVQRGNGSDSVENIFDDLRQGRVRARQKPGSKNPLGKVKFVFPNKADVYLHDTPSHNLFARDRRDFSHGCVRVAEAEKLAEFVLSFQSGWDSNSIKTAMEGSKTQRVRLKQAIPVLFFYTTSFVDENNRLHFYHDIYGQNEALEKALKREPAVLKQDDSVLSGKNVSAG